MDTIYEKTLLFDFYGELLTEKQREICRMYWQEDWSLSEISEALQISRQGVSDALRRSLRLLQQSEQKLRICERFLSLKPIRRNWNTCSSRERMRRNVFGTYGYEAGDDTRS